jgi:pimeloyl-ACP methyl ester carboxylesterase
VEAGAGLEGKGMLKTVLGIIVTSAVITLCIALGLIASQRPVEITGGDGLDFTNTLASDRVQPAPLAPVAMRDGFPLQVREYLNADPDAPMVILVHGSGWHGLQFDTIARSLSADAHVLVPDLRGHGPKPGRRGDIDYIGQFEDDLADLIAAKQRAGQNVVLAGHSSGGGLVTRFAGGADGRCGAARAIPETQRADDQTQFRRLGAYAFAPDHRAEHAEHGAYHRAEPSDNHPVQYAPCGAGWSFG